jgi:hypothetical protein
MATPNYSFAKKQRELAKKQKKAEKQQRRTGSEKPGEDAAPTPGKAPPAAE